MPSSRVDHHRPLHDGFIINAQKTGNVVRARIAPHLLYLFTGRRKSVRGDSRSPSMAHSARKQTQLGGAIFPPAAAFWQKDVPSYKGAMVYKVYKNKECRHCEERFLRRSNPEKHWIVTRNKNHSYHDDNTRLPRKILCILLAMTLSCFLSLTPASAETFETTNIADTSLSSKFQTLLITKNAKEASEIKTRKESAAAIADITFMHFKPTIENLPDYDSYLPFIFNCTIFFDDNFKKATCDVDLDPDDMTMAEVDPGHSIIRSHLSKVAENTILITRSYVDLSHGKKNIQGLWDLFYKYNAKKSTTLGTSVTSSVEPTPSIEPTETIPKTLTPKSSETQSINPTLTAPITNTKTNTLSKTPSKSSSILRSQTITPPEVESNWLASSGMYADATDQAGRYTTSNGVVTDTYTGFEWEQASSSSGMTWQEGKDYCAAQNTGGYNDWRLPTALELQSLVDYTITYNTPPGINLTYFPSTPAEHFWVSDPTAGDATKAWYVRFNDYSGYSYYEAITNTKYVRCIRGTKDTLTNRYEEPIAGVVKDNLTGLEWKKTAPTTGMIWSSAKTHCESQTTGGHNDWRLPTIKELSTIIDRSVAPGSLCMDPVFAGETVDYYWSSTPVSGRADRACYVYFYDGNVSAAMSVAATECDVCVRLLPTGTN